jgi:S-adenosylmethionine hydrolase
VDVAGERFHATFASTFADVRRGDIVLYEDAYRSLALAINRGDAASTLQLAPDSRVVLRPR